MAVQAVVGATALVKALDAEMIDLIEDEEALADEIERADNFKEGIFDALT